MDILFQQGRNKRGQVGFFPESYVEVGSTSAVSTPTSSYTDGPPVGSPVSVSSVGKATLGSRKYRECGLSIMLFWCGGGGGGGGGQSAKEVSFKVAACLLGRL